MPKNRPFLFILLALAGVLAFCSNHYLQVITRSSDLSANAFLNARWGMSPDEVKAANELTLMAPNTNKRFFSPKPSEEGRFQTLLSQDQSFFGRDADIYYTFKDGRLCMYHVFVSDDDAERLDADMRKYLRRVWGDQASDAQDDAPLKLVWQFKDKIVNYWFYEEEITLARPYKAGFGVTYSSIADS